MNLDTFATRRGEGVLQFCPQTIDAANTRSYDPNGPHEEALSYDGIFTFYRLGSEEDLEHKNRHSGREWGFSSVPISKARIAHVN